MQSIVRAAAAGVFGLALAGLSFAPLLAQGLAHAASEGAYTPDQAERGKAAYDASCAMCHGVGLEGNDSAPPLAGPRFTGNWKGQTVSDLATRIRTTMPLNSPGSMGTGSVADVTAYILSMNEYKAGGAELPKDNGAQKRIQIN